MAETKIFPKGVIAFKPHEKAPKWVVASVIITVPDLKEWLEREGRDYLGDYKGKEQLKLQITEFGGKFSIQVDTFGLKKKDEEFRVSDSHDDDDSLPF